MNYQNYQPHPDLESLIAFYWTLEVPKLDNPSKQLILPDGHIEMIFMLGEEVKRYTSENDFILQPRAMVLGQITEPFYIEPTGIVESFAVSFYPYGFANFINAPITSLANKETALSTLFEEKTINALAKKITNAEDTKARIQLVEAFLLNRLKEIATVDKIVKSTVDSLFLSKGKNSIKSILKEEPSKRRQLERKFKTQIGLSPKQLSKVIRLQATLEMILHQDPNKLTNITYENGYYDQSHFIKDFKDFTGINPSDFLEDEKMALSSLFYSKK